MQDVNHAGVLIIIDEPTYIGDIDIFIANWVRENQDLLRSRGSIVGFADKKAIVRSIWEILIDPNRSCDHISVNDRVSRIGHLERLFRTQITSKGQLRDLVERFLGGLDGRRLSIPKALIRARRKSGLGQRQLAKLLGLKDHGLISRYESGKREPSARVLGWLKETEDVTEKDRVKGKSRPPRSSVTTLWGNTKPISANSAKSETLPKQPKCTSTNIAPQTAGEEGEICALQAGYPNCAEGTASLTENTEGATDSEMSVKKANHGE